jgi:two-component system, chemotaxis family, CheB/CheR fusion protein
MSTKVNQPSPAKGVSPNKNREGIKSHKRTNFPIVGIGASAGGLETLETFFSKMPPAANIAFVIIQHLSPKFKSIMASLLAKYTRMTVSEIEDGTALAPNCVYLNPPDKNVAVFNRTLHLMEPVKSGSINMPIDFFFRSLSEDQKEKAIGIIVSGTASDGTLGIKAIKGAGGMVIVQDPDTAKYDGMPRNAIGTGLVDLILPVEKMPAALISYVKHPFLSSPGKINISETNIQHQLQKVFALIRSATGHDFSQYKPTTIQRRIERRLAVHQISKLADYIVYMQKNPLEINSLFKDLVIGVTNFFRDPEAYQVIEEKVLPNLLQHKRPDDPLRCWVVGCSTGEEAYSLAMLVSEAMEKLKKHLNVQIFATDIDEAAIENARKGIFPNSIAADVSKERLAKFFTKDDTIYRVKKQIRGMIVFSLHSIIKDPPFSRLDLVSCRNLMIYLDHTLQKKIVPIFHYVLNPGGGLLLGTSETIGEFTDLFQPLNSKWKVFQRKESLAEGLIYYPTKIGYGGGKSIKPNAPLKMAMATDIQSVAEKAILSEYGPTGVLIDDKYEILHFVGPTEKYLVPPMGKPSFNILKMAREDLKYKLTAALHKAVREKKRIDCKGVRIKHNNIFCIVDIAISPVTDEGLPPGLLLVIFEENIIECRPEENSGKEPAENLKDPTEYELEQELQSTREYLQATIEELETSNEELNSNNEEMQSVNEELQSTNEELETSKEELQSTNEELATVNSELQQKVSQLSKASDDMNNLLSATEIASIFMDIHLNIKRYTPAAARIIKLIPTDLGRPLSDLSTSFPGVDLVDYARLVLKDLNTLEAEILSQDGKWHALKVMPYRTSENVIAGVVMTVVDIHRVKQADKIRRFATVLEDSNDAITVQDFKGRILAWNKGAAKMYGWTEYEALKMNIEELIPKEKLKENNAFMGKFKKGETLNSLKTKRMTKGGKILDIWLTATVLIGESGEPIEIATTERNLAWLPAG